MSGFLFDGRSRQVNMQFARDTRPSRDQLLVDAQKRRMRREEEGRRTRAATAIQRAVRGLLATQEVLRRCVDVLTALPASPETETPPSRAGPASGVEGTQHGYGAGELPARLGQACWAYQYLRPRTLLLPVSVLSTAAPAEGGVVTSTSPCLQECSTAAAAVTGPCLVRASRHARGQALVRQCTHRLVASLRLVLRHRAGLAPLLAALPPTAVSFLTHVLLEDYTTSIAEGSGSAAERAFRGLQELATATVEVGAVADPPTDASAMVGRLVAGCLSFSAAHMSSLPSGRARLLKLLTPLVPVCAPAFAVAAGVCSHEEEGVPGEATTVAPRPSGSNHSAAWHEACWACLVSTCDDAYLPLTANPIAALLSAEEGDGAVSGSRSSHADEGVGGRDSRIPVVLMVLQVAYERIVRHCFMDSGPHGGVGGLVGATGLPSPPPTAAAGATAASVGGRWWETAAMAALGRLTRMLPLFSTTVGVHPFDERGFRLARVVWLACIGVLCERLCQTEAFTQAILLDLHHARVPPAATEAGVPAQVRRRGRYRALASHLFSSEGGLRLMELLAAAAEAGEAASLVDSTVTGEGVPAAAGSDRAVDEADPVNFFSPDDTARLLAVSDLEAVCGVYAWPLFSFSLASAQRRLETAAIFAKLIHAPLLMRHLWRLYRRRCEGLAALLPPGELLQKLCTMALKLNVAVRLPRWTQAPPELLAAKGLRGRAGMFWDPNPAFAALFFTLLGYYIDVTDFSLELERGTVLTREEAWALILAMKEIVHRSHLYGVVPGENCEAVAHLAFILLGKLHVIDEASPFVPYPSLWISTTDQATMNALGTVSPDDWEALSLKLAWEQRTLERVLDGEAAEGGVGEGGARSANASDDEEAVAVAGPGAAGRGTSVGPRRPGDDVLFSDSVSWPLEERVVRLLVHAPFTIPFPERAALLTMLLLSRQPMRMPGRPRFFVAHRGRTFVDAYERFHTDADSPDMYSVRFAAAARRTVATRAGPRPPPGGDAEDAEEEEGLEEGYGQGVYREFIVSVCKEGFAADHGLFQQTEDGFVYPNPFSFEATGDAQHLQKISFLGTMVGRAFRDGILQDYPFALHFRNSLLSRRNSINNLRSFDAQLYHQLMSLTRMSKEDLEGMGLTFTYTVNALGITKEVELIKGGASVYVTPTNSRHYAQLVADFKLNREGHMQMQAFKAGLEAVIQRSWLQLFDSNELLNLLGGDRSGRIDIEDWRRHTTCTPAEAANSAPVRLFWEVVLSLTTEQQSKLLKFATSMNRPPLLGFRFLNPPFNIYMLPASAVDRLPSASTCFSMLKLPPYTDYATARAKIIAAIEETNSFGLT